MSEEIGSEHWKQIEEFPDYYISDQGRVFNMKRLRLMKIGWNGTNEHVTLVRDGKSYGRSVDKLLRIYFKQPIFVDFNPKTDLKRIHGFPGYLISWRGDIWSIKRNRFVGHHYNNHGVKCVFLWKNGKSHTRSVDALIMRAFKIGRKDALQLLTNRMEADRRVS